MGRRAALDGHLARGPAHSPPVARLSRHAGQELHRPLVGPRRKAGPGMSLVLDWILPAGPWLRSNGYPFLLDSIRWLRMPARPECHVTEALLPYEIDSMAYIFNSLDAIT